MNQLTYRQQHCNRGIHRQTNHLVETNTLACKKVNMKSIRQHGIGLWDTMGWPNKGHFTLKGWSTTRIFVSWSEEQICMQISFSHSDILDAGAKHRGLTLIALVDWCQANTEVSSKMHWAVHFLPVQMNLQILAFHLQEHIAEYVLDWSSVL